jgi:hypothetical protein
MNWKNFTNQLKSKWNPLFFLDNRFDILSILEKLKKISENEDIDKKYSEDIEFQNWIKAIINRYNLLIEP